MTTAGSDSLVDQVEIDVSAIGQDDIARLLADANAARTTPSGRVWFLFGSAAEDSPCLVVGVRGDVGALEWIAEQRFVPADGLNQDWVGYYTVDLHDNAMPPHAERPVDEALAVAAEFVRTRERPGMIEWRLA